MTPGQAIAALDRALRVAGGVRHVKLRRYTGTTNRVPLDVDVRMQVRDYAPEELVGGIAQGDRKCILSPTQMVGRQWCWPPRRGDKAIIDGKEHNVEAANPISMQDTLVRIELQVRG